MKINQPKIEGLQKSDSEPAPPLLCLAPVLLSLDLDLGFSSFYDLQKAEVMLFVITYDHVL